MEKNNPHDNEFYQKGISLYRKKNYDYAIELFGEVLKDNPDFDACRRYLWDSIRQKNTSSKKCLPCLIATKIKINFLMIRFFMLNLNQNNLKAYTLIQQIILIDPNNISAFFSLASLHLKNNAQNQAIATLEEVLSIDKNNLPALKILANTYYTNKSYEKAKLIAIKILDLSPRYIQAENILNNISALGTIEKGFDEIKPAT